jgi:CRP/FNR family transcriptional regulator, cyclic AMP receptor protein
MMMTWVEVVGYLASALVFATFCMKTMIPLRVAAIFSNIAFIVYASYFPLYPILILHSVLLPMNVWRTVEVLRLIRRVNAAAKGDLSVDWLRPFMKEVRHKAGDVLFGRGDHGDCFYMVLNGQVRVQELDHVAGPGDVVGEIALFAPDHRRTQTVRCLTDASLLSISEKDLAQLCFQRPAVSFYLLRLITYRLAANAAQVQRTAQLGLGKSAGSAPFSPTTS